MSWHYFSVLNGNITIVCRKYQVLSIKHVSCTNYKMKVNSINHPNIVISNILDQMENPRRSGTSNLVLPCVRLESLASRSSLLFDFFSMAFKLNEPTGTYLPRAYL